MQLNNCFETLSRETVLTDSTPYQAFGDFDGDGIKDIAAIFGSVGLNGTARIGLCRSRFGCESWPFHRSVARHVKWWDYPGLAWEWCSVSYFRQPEPKADLTFNCGIPPIYRGEHDGCIWPLANRDLNIDYDCIVH